MMPKSFHADVVAVVLASTVSVQSPDTVVLCTERLPRPVPPTTGLVSTYLPPETVQVPPLVVKLAADEVNVSLMSWAWSGATAKTNAPRLVARARRGVSRSCEVMGVGG